MKKLLASLLVCLICPGPNFAQAALTNESTSDVIPVSKAYGDIQQAVDAKNQIIVLSESSPTVPPLAFQVPTDPFDNAFLRFSVNREKNTVVYESAPGQVHQALLNTKTNTAVFSYKNETGETSKLTLKFKLSKSGNLTLTSATAETNRPGGMSSTITHRYSVTGEYTGFSLLLSGADYWESVGMSKTSGSDWSVSGFSNDTVAGVFAFYNFSKDPADLKSFFSNTANGSIPVGGVMPFLDQGADIKSMVYLSDSPYLIQSYKNDSGEWVARVKLTLEDEELKTHILDQGAEKLFTQEQTVLVGTESFIATYGPVGTDGHRTLGLTLQSDAQTLTLDYPASDILTLNGKEYRVRLQADGTLTLQEVVRVLRMFAPGMDPNKINTNGWEDSPYVTPDGQKMYFMYTPTNFFPMFLNEGLPVIAGPERTGHHTNANPWEDADIYVSTKNPDGSWGAPVNLNINAGDGECCMMTTDNDTVMYLQKRNAVGSPDKGDIYLSRKDANGQWSAPENVGAPVNTEWHESNPHVTAGEKSLYFMSDRPGSSNGRDLYVSHRLPNGEWGEAENLGPKINAGMEDQVWVNDDETIMYFGRENSSEGTIFKSEFRNGEWTDPVPVTFGTNPLIGEISFSDDMKKAYFAVADLAKKDIVLSYSELQPDGTWSEPKPID